MKKYSTFLLLLTLVICFSFVEVYAGATTRTWTGTTSTAWNVASNWGGTVPTSEENASIPSAPSNQPTITSSMTAACRALTIDAGATLSMTGGTLSIYHDWRNTGTFNATGGTVVFEAEGGLNRFNSPGTNQFFNITISSGVSRDFSLNLSAQIGVRGNWTNNGTAIMSGTNFTTVTFNGSTAQTIGGSSTTTFYNLTFNNTSGGISLNVNTIADGTLTMTSGNITTGAYTLTLGTSTTVRGTLSRTSGTIIGNFRRWFNAGTVSNVLFPIGTSTNYRPANISFTSAPSTGGTLTAFFTPTDPGTAGLPLDDGGTSIINTGKEGYWTINATTLAGGTYSLDLTADGFTGVSVVSTLRLLKRTTGGNWTVQGTHSAGTGTTTTPTVHRTGMSGFSEFGIGGASDNPLPVELSSFTAKALSNGKIQLNWRTETEVSNYGFEVERLQDYNIEKLQDWRKIGFVEGNGNSNSPKEYSFTDNNTRYGKYDYRLKQIDTDGQFEYSETIEVDAGNIPDGFVLEQNYPNPFNPSTTIKFALAETQSAKLIIYDVLGNEVAIPFSGTAEGGKLYTVEFSGETLSSGIYFYRLETDNKVENRKMLLLK